MSNNNILDKDMIALLELMKSLSSYIVFSANDNIVGHENSLFITLLQDIPFNDKKTSLTKGTYLIGNNDVCVYSFETDSEVSGVKIFKATPIYNGIDKLKLAELITYIYKNKPTRAIKKAFENYCKVTGVNLLESNSSFIMPSSPVIYLANKSVNSISAERDISVNKNTEITYTTHDNSVTITSTRKDSGSISEITFDDIYAIQGKNNKGLLKLFNFFLIKANEQKYADVISFPLQDIVDNGIYSSLANARRGLEANIGKILGLSVKGVTYKGKRSISEAEGGHIFYHYTLKNNFVSIYLNKQINIDFVAQFYTMLPSYTFRLNTNAFNLINYIYFIARQRTKEIKENGYFNINFQSICDYLALPKIGTVREQKKLIRDPVEKAIEEIEEYANGDLYITPILKNYDCSVSEWLQCYLQVELKGEYADFYTGISQKTENKVKRAERIKEKAEIQAEAKKIENSKKKKEK